MILTKDQVCYNHKYELKSEKKRKQYIYKEKFAKEKETL